MHALARCLQLNLNLTYLGDVRSSLSLAGISPEGRAGDVSRVGMWLGTPNGYAAVVQAMACKIVPQFNIRYGISKILKYGTHSCLL